MEKGFWHQRWQEGRTPFHESDVNPALLRNFARLSLALGSRIFVPLCGKTLDIGWLLSQGYRVAGAELSPLAITQLFAQLGVQPKVAALGKMDHYSAENIDIFVGDIFDLSREMLGPVDGIYDRAAIVALPQEMRVRYAAHLEEITERAPQLLLTFEYDQTAMDGPPFSVSGEELRRLYGGSYALTQLSSAEVPDGLKGLSPAWENIWLLAH